MAPRPPLVVTGMPRSGTSFAGKMLELSGRVVYVNEPMNPSHPPGRSPGVLNADVGHYFHYIGADDRRWRKAFRRTAGLRYGVLAELRRNHSRYDLARAVKYAGGFTRGRLTGRRALIDDPYALASVGWLARTLDATVVVLVRDPLSLVSSWQRLDWHVDPRELLDQPELMADHLAADEGLLRGSLEAGPAEQTAVLWRALYTVALAAAGDERILFRRYEDLAGDPAEGFRRLYADCGLTWTDEVADGVRLATSGGPGGVGRDRAEAFRWSLGSGVSRTAFRPMDSAGVLKAQAAGTLGAEQDGRVRELTADVLARLDGRIP